MEFTAASVGKERLKRRRRAKLRRSAWVWLMFAPAIGLLLVFHYFPIYGIVMAFEDYSPFRGFLGSKWVGLQHFRRFLTDENYWRVMRNTIVINLYQLIFGFPFPILFALMLNELWSNRSKRVMQTFSYLPHFISWVVVASIVTELLSPTTGLVNMVLTRVFGMEPIYFLIKQRYFRTILVVSGIWKTFGMSSVYYIAALSGIDTELYEAAAIDGAGKLRQTWHITLPGLRNIIIVLLVLRMGNMITIGFEQVFLLYNPLVYDVGDVISTYTYRLGLVDTQYSLTTAIGLTQSVVNFAMVYGANRLAKRVAGWSLW
ncbi:MAG: ABC transporter permease subunit [Eubacteriales bacterium]|nr:ABC transporter permease subunit [Eubacteriales bacterium]MDY5014658.1 ABC transporter permease subunit [Eubacteriales bacterium]